MVRPIKNEPQRPAEQTQKSHNDKKTSTTLKQGQKAINDFMSSRGKELLRAGRPPVISKHAPKKASERVSTVASASPSLHQKKRSK